MRLPCLSRNVCLRKSMKKKNEFSRLIGQSATTKASRSNLDRLSSSPNRATAQGNLSSGSLRRPGASGDMRSQSLSSAGQLARGIDFGSPSNNRITAAADSGEWSRLVKQTASGGLSSAFGGGLWSAIGGLGGVVSSIAGLFGGSKKSPPPLTLFHLPDSENRAVSVSSSESRNSQSGPIYGGAAVDQHQPYTYQSAQVAQAVKQAILNSSSLNDVIAEI